MRFHSALPLLSFLLCAATAQAAPPAKVRFNHDIRPLMSDTCFHCHGPDKTGRKGGLRLDIRDEALKAAKSGAIPIVPGKPEESEIIKRLYTTDKDDLMPPVEAHKDFTPAQKELMKRWVAEGAVYEPQWAYTPLVKPPVPKVPDAQTQPTNPIDSFIQDKLAENHLKPSPQADARTLIRRLSLDLIGLPPTPAETEAFVQSAIRNPKSAISEAADRLLKSPHFGERMAVWWLDVARFTDTVGYHGDQNQRIFPYRDYVISAFNQNKRFDRFTQEQLAGDLLPAKDEAERTTNLVASGFNRLNMVTREGGAQAKEYLAKYGAERVRTVGGAWLGATLGCCECHDHKFDPFTARDFYSMESFFADVKQWGVYASYGYTPVAELKGWTNDHPFPPEIQVDSPYLQQRAQRIRGEMLRVAAAPTTDEKVQTAFAQWRNESTEFLHANPSGWATPAPTVAVAPATPVKVKGGSKADAKAAKAKAKAGATAKLPEVPPTVVADGRVIFHGKAADNASITVQPPTGWVSAVRVELLPDASHKGSILRDDSQNNSASLKLTASALQAKSTKALPLAFRHADADLKDPRYSGGFEIIGVADAWKTSEKAWNQPQTAVCLLKKPMEFKAGDTLTLKIDGNLAGCVRVSVSPFAPVDVLDKNFAQALSSDLGGKDAAHSAALLEAYLAGTAWNEAVYQNYTELDTKRLQCRGGKAWTMVTQQMDPLTVHILPRGNFMDESGPIVTPATPGFLPAALRPQEGKRLTRLDLAKWLCSQENPLTPRAVMNRLWKQFYGNGLSAVVDDLGAQGEPPSHPELLDWLAAEFRDSGWDMKHMIRLMVTSQTYLQSSAARSEVHELDPNNRLLSFQNPRRLDAEFVRDNALSIAGLINLDMGGPSIYPYQPAGYYANLQFPNRDYYAETDDRQWRRGVYMHWQRTFLHPMLANFDAPMRDECTANRPYSNTPQQALTLLNDPTFVEAARVFAARVLTEKVPNDAARLDRAYELALARPVKDKEKTSLLAFLKTQRECYQADSSAADKIIRIGNSAVCGSCDRNELAAWTNVCRVILNLHETITRF